MIPALGFAFWFVLLFVGARLDLCVHPEPKDPNVSDESFRSRSHNLQVSTFGGFLVLRINIFNRGHLKLHVFSLQC